MYSKFFSLLLIFIHGAHSANILFYLNIASYSHRVIIYPLADALAKRGHEVTFISPYHPRQPDPNPNVTEIVPEKMSHTMVSFLSAEFDINYRIQKLIPGNTFAFYPTAIKACEELLTSPELRDYLDRTTSLDLLVLDNCWCECALGIAHKYKAKHIYLSTLALWAFEHDFYGIIPESSAIPEMEIFQPRVPLSFLERVENAFISIHARYVHYNYYSKEIDRLIRTHMKLNDTMPFVDDMARNMSLVLYTGDVVTDFPKSFPPMIVNVGGIHCTKGKGPEELPKDIQEFLHGEMDGFVYVSLGSLVVSSDLPEETRRVFFQTIESYPNLKFLWKWNGPFPENIPKNLFLAKWFPQMDILAHPKIKAFITQSGRPSTLESVCSGVPMIAFPVLADQDANANRVNDMGGNVILELGTVTREGLDDAIKKVVYDGGMKTRMLELRTILEDRPMSPLDTAVWWTDYVLRHKDTSHLKPAGYHQTWYQRRMLDVWAFVFLSILLTLVIIAGISLAILKLAMKAYHRLAIIPNNNNNSESGLSGVTSKKRR